MKLLNNHLVFEKNISAIEIFLGFVVNNPFGQWCKALAGFGILDSGIQKFVS
jgi:hypothetical protein